MNAILAITAAASIAAMLVVSHQPAPVTVQWSDAIVRAAARVGEGE